MKKITFTKLLAVLTALCLLFTLPAAAAAETSVNPEEPGDWLAEQIGAWIGRYRGAWSQFTFYPNGSYEIMDFESPSLNRSGTVLTFAREGEAALQGEFLYITIDEEYSVFKQIKTPYIRMKAVNEKTSLTVDPELVGTYGGMRMGSYAEWIFSGTGGFTEVIPYSTSEKTGYYTAAGGNLEIHVGTETEKYAYKISADSLRLETPDTEKLSL